MERRGEEGGEGVRCRSLNASCSRRVLSKVASPPVWRRVSGKLTRPLTNHLTPSLIDFLQRAPFANGVSGPSVASEPVDVTLPDLIAAPRFQQCSPTIPGHALGAHRPKDPDPSFPLNLYVQTFPLRSHRIPFSDPQRPTRIVGMQDAGTSSSMMPKVTFASPPWHTETTTGGRGGEK